MKAKEMSFMDLKTYIKDNKEKLVEENEYNSLLTSFHNKFAYPISCILLAVIGACLGITQRRSIINWGYVGMGAIVFVFYISQSVFDSIGENGVLPAWAAMWTPNLIFLLVCLAVFKYKAEN